MMKIRLRLTSELTTKTNNAPENGLRDVAPTVNVVAMSAARHDDANPVSSARNHARVAPTAFATTSSTQAIVAASAKCPKTCPNTWATARCR